MMDVVTEFECARFRHCPSVRQLGDRLLVLFASYSEEFDIRI